VYVYDASGVKHQAKYRYSKSTSLIPLGETTTENSLASSFQTDYCGNYVYEKSNTVNPILIRILTPDGYISTDSGMISYLGNWNYTYFLKDHLGNTHVNITSDYLSKNTSKTYAASNLIDYFPFGLERNNTGQSSGGPFDSGTNPYLFNGKEIDRMNGLNENDYGGRWYDPAVGGWSSVDPLAEKYYSISPYAYCLNNPVKYLDPDGKEVWLSYTFNDGRTVTAQYKNGGLYNSDGSKYQGGNSYILKTGQQLSQLQNVSKEVNGIVSSLANDDNIHSITNVDAADPNEEGNSNRSVNIADDGIIKGVTESNNTITKYDPDATENVAGDKRDPKVGLAHELKHDYDRSNGGLRKGTTKNGIKNYEVDAVNVENQVRKKTGEPQRTTYGVKKIPKEDLK